MARLASVEAEGEKCWLIRDVWGAEAVFDSGKTCSARSGRMKMQDKLCNQQEKEVDDQFLCQDSISKEEDGQPLARVGNASAPTVH